MIISTNIFSLAIGSELYGKWLSKPSDSMLEKKYMTEWYALYDMPIQISQK